MVWGTDSAVSKIIHSLGAKLVLAFLVVSIIGIALMVVSAYWATTREFDRFLWDQNRSAVEEAIISYYLENSSLEGLDLTPDGLGMQQAGAEDGEFTPRGFQIADADGNMVFPPGNPAFPDQERTINLERAVPVEYGGAVIAYLKIPENPMAREPAELAFLRRARMMFFYGAGAAVLVALVLGILLSRQLVRPLREMNTATLAVAEGDLELRVPVRSQDEIGRLARSFNRMNDRLAEARDQRRQLTADIAHELRTPLSIILGHAEAAVDGVIPLTSENAAVILDEAERLERIVEDLRVLSLADTGELKYEMEPCELKGIVEHAAAAYRSIAAARNISIVEEVQDGLPAVTVDPNRMSQVLNNLMANAIRYTSPGGTITVTAQLHEDHVEMQVSDEGPGIPEEDLDRIFTRFYRVDRSRGREDGGTGLGLAIARSIVAYHQGEITARNNAAAGCTFTIRLPVMMDQDQREA